MSPQKLEAESHPQMRRHRVNPLHLTWCLWADHDLAQCSTPRPEQSKLLPFISARPPVPSPLQSQLVSVLELDPFGSEMTKPALLVLVPCPWQCPQSWNRGLYFLISCRRRALSMLASARASFMVWSSLCNSGTCLSYKRQAENKAGVFKVHSELLQGKTKAGAFGMNYTARHNSFWEPLNPWFSNKELDTVGKMEPIRKQSPTRFWKGTSEFMLGKVPSLLKTLIGGGTGCSLGHSLPAAHHTCPGLQTHNGKRELPALSCPDSNRQQ